GRYGAWQVMGSDGRGVPGDSSMPLRQAQGRLLSAAKGRGLRIAKSAYADPSAWGGPPSRTLGRVLADLFVGPIIGTLITAILVVAAYQVRVRYDVPFGTATDGVLLRGFNAGEQVAGKD